MRGKKSATMKMVSFVVMSLFFLFPAHAGYLHPEKWDQEKRGAEQGGQAEVRLADGTRADYLIAAQDRRGKAARSIAIKKGLNALKKEFQKLHPCPSTGKSSGACPGYVIDYVVPPERGGADAVENLQWRAIDDVKAKDNQE